ncbi:MAG: hypothetical protein JRM95_04565 [Nitrososphaerota archaeon]|nr:hypothetical protein [Nitrososphaerota archaeon]
MGSATEYRTVWWGYCCAAFEWAASPLRSAASGLWCWPANAPYTVYTFVPFIETYSPAEATTTCSQQYEGLSQSCPPTPTGSG